MNFGWNQTEPKKEGDPADVPALFVLMGKTINKRYHESSAQDARRRIRAFFAEHLT